MESNNNIIEQFDKELIELELKSKYSNTVIYKIVCKDVNINLVYVGHTINIKQRRITHKSNCNNAKNEIYYNLKVYKEIRKNGGWSNFNMIEIEKYPCSNKYEACKREKYYYEKLNANLNSVVPGSCSVLIKEERLRQYKEDREKIKKNYEDYTKLYNEENKKYKKLFIEQLNK